MNEEQFLKLSLEPCVLGVDPGATNTAWVVIHEETGTVLHSSTIKRAEGMKPFAWAMRCVRTTAEAVNGFNITKMGVEGVEEPNVYHNGKKNMLRPLFLINTGIVAGAYAVAWEHLNPVVVRPSKNGSGPKESYPEELVGSRPKTLDGTPLPGIRNHERSSYDVAKKALIRYSEEYVYDHRVDHVGELILDKVKKKAAKKKPAVNETAVATTTTVKKDSNEPASTPQGDNNASTEPKPVRRKKPVNKAVERDRVPDMLANVTKLRQ